MPDFSSHYGLLNQEATKCRLALESFFHHQEKYIVDGEKEGSLDGFIAVDRYIAWAAHLYEILKLCVSIERRLGVNFPEDELAKRIASESKEKPGKNHRQIATKQILNHIEECGMNAVRDESPYLDSQIVFSSGFSTSLKKIRDKYYAHPTKDRLGEDFFSDFVLNHHSTAFCTFRVYALYWSDLKSFEPGAQQALIKHQNVLADYSRPKR
ncbi:hypothetical protein EBB56_09255 [Halomonas sp. YLB-10]|uniref:hypothetical protein n=1 Tax=Halomonas sp. YLB-10 TaxID=2483111 RepID=UPI000F5F3C2A|nr:hypothetical protein [Halomonas sp. YLB-10]RQW71337.1 hypothetical protein EBB56_09255 [Halomonas sp. YLB-10]